MRLPKCGARGTLAVRALPPAPLAAERPPCPHGIHVRNFRSVLEHTAIRSPSRDYIYHIFPTRSHVQNFCSVLGHAAIRSPSRDYIYHIFLIRSRVQNFRSVLEHAAIRSPSRTTHRSLFFWPELEQNRINGDQLFCTRDRACEAFSLASNGLLEQFLERDHALATRATLLKGMLPELRMSALCALHLKRVCFCVFFVCFFLLVFCFVLFSRRLSVQISHITYTIQ